MESANKRRRIFLLFLNLSAVPKKRTRGKFTYISHFQRIGTFIHATKFEKWRYRFRGRDVTLEDSQRRFLAQHSVVTLEQQGRLHSSYIRRVLDNRQTIPYKRHISFEI